MKRFALADLAVFVEAPFFRELIAVDCERDGVHVRLEQERATGTALTRYLYDNVNIPVMLDYIAANVLVNDTDDAQKNYYLYRDTNDGASAFYDGANTRTKLDPKPRRPIDSAALFAGALLRLRGAIV